MIIDIEGHEKAGKTTLREKMCVMMPWTITYSGYRPSEQTLALSWDSYVKFEHMTLGRINELNPGIIILADRLLYDIVKLIMKNKNCTNTYIKARMSLAPDVIIIVKADIQTLRTRGNIRSDSFLEKEMEAINTLPKYIKDVHATKRKPIVYEFYPTDENHTEALMRILGEITDKQAREILGQERL